MNDLADEPIVCLAHGASLSDEEMVALREFLDLLDAQREGHNDQ